MYNRTRITNFPGNVYLAFVVTGVGVGRTSWGTYNRVLADSVTPRHPSVSLR